MDINEKIREVKKMIMSITKHFNYSLDVINILTICYIAIVSFDNEAQDILEEVLATKYILIYGKGFSDVFKNYYPNINPAYDHYIEPSLDEDRIWDNDFISIRTFGLPTKKDSSIGNKVRAVMESFLHEIKHAMNSRINRYENGIFYCGLCIIHYKGGRIYELLEEAFNSFMTYLYLQQVNKLKEHDISDEGIRGLLEFFSLEKYTYSYAQVTNLLVPLFSNKEIFILFYNAVLYKDYEPLFKLLDKLFCNRLYVLDELLTNFYNCVDSNIYEYISYNKGYDSLNFKNSSIEKMTL